MKNYWLVIPKNKNLFHCPESFYLAINLTNTQEFQVNYLALRSFIEYFKNLITLTKSVLVANASTSIFLFAINLRYVPLVLVLRTIAYLKNGNLKIYYLMHEPFIEFRRGKYSKVIMIFLFNKLLGMVSNQVFLPSDNAVKRALHIVPSEKSFKVNLTFPSQRKQNLIKNLAQLESAWKFNKKFSFLGTFYNQENNPDGFVSFMNIACSIYGDQVDFVRAGRDLVGKVSYDTKRIIEFPGYLSQNGKSFLMGLSHFLVIPYLNNTQSGTVTEALAYGKLLIINDIESFKDIKDLDFTLVVDFSSPDSILNCLDKIFSMSFQEYEQRYWSAIEFFEKNHSESYLNQKLKNAQII